MFYGFIGGDDEARRWLDRCRTLARRTGQRGWAEGRLRAEGETVALHVAWAGPDDERLKPPQVLSRGDAHKVHLARGAHYPGEPDPAIPTLLQPGHEAFAVVEPGSLRIAVPIATPQQVYYFQDERGTALATDLRAYPGWFDTAPDATALISMMQFGLVAAPRTIYEGVKRIPGGHQLSWSAREGRLRLERALPAVEAWPEPQEPGDPVEMTAEVLDRVLAAVPDSAMLFFSGGVDSGLLAARLAEAGRRDVRLVFGALRDPDPFAEIARRMADVLGMKMDVVPWAAEAVPPFLADLGRRFTYPFADEAVLPTRQILDAAGLDGGAWDGVLDGTGADNGFGVGYKEKSWAKLLRRLPRPAQRATAGALGMLKPWWRDVLLEKPWRILRSDLAFSEMMGGAMAQNMLHGVAYDVPADMRQQLIVELDRPAQQFAGGMSDMDVLSLLSVMHESAGQVAAKTHDMVRAAGALPLYPFLQAPVLRLGYSMDPRQKNAGGRNKAPLKDLLARSVPRELIEVPKGAMIPPLAETLRSGPVQEIARHALLEDGGALEAVIERGFVRQALDRAHRGGFLSHGVRKWLWSALFSALWLRQVDELTAGPDQR